MSSASFQHVSSHERLGSRLARGHEGPWEEPGLPGPRRHRAPFSLRRPVWGGELKAGANCGTTPSASKIGAKGLQTCTWQGLAARPRHAQGLEMPIGPKFWQRLDASPDLFHGEDAMLIPDPQLRTAILRLIKRSSSVSRAFMSFISRITLSTPFELLLICI